MLKRRTLTQLLAATALAPVSGVAQPRPPLSRIAFGSCAEQRRPQPIWDAILAYHPDLFIFAGDNVYGDFATADAAGLKQAYDSAMTTLQPRYGNWVIFEHCMPFNVSRAYDEAKGLDHPRIWTAERDIEMWTALEQAG